MTTPERRPFGPSAAERLFAIDVELRDRARMYAANPSYANAQALRLAALAYAAFEKTIRSEP